MNPQETPKPENNPASPDATSSNLTQGSIQGSPQVVVGGQSDLEIAAQTSSINAPHNEKNKFTPPQAEPPRNRSIAKKIILIGMILVIVIVVAVTLFATLGKKDKKSIKASAINNSVSSSSVIPAGFKSITYNNGSGSNFQLLFYANYTSSKGVNAQQLVSNVNKYGLYPLVLQISELSNENSIDQQLIADGINCVFSAGPTNSNDTIHVKDKAIGNTINMCAIEGPNSSSPEIYLGILKASNNYFQISIIQAPSGLDRKKQNLLAYKDDIVTIVSSIKIISSHTPTQPNSTPSASQESSNVFTVSGLLEPSDINHNECPGLYSPPYTLWNNDAVSGGATCSDAQNVLAGATTNVNGGNYSADGYKCSSVKNGVGYKNAARWPLEITGTFYSYSCSSGNKQVAFNWYINQ